MKRTILLADHDEPVRKMLARVLESAGYVALQACSGSEVLAQLRVAKPELVLLDVETPQQWADLEALKQAQPGLPIILMTEWRNGQERPLDRKVAARVPKPLDLRLLLEQIEELLSPPKRGPRSSQTTAKSAARNGASLTGALPKG